MKTFRNFVNGEFVDAVDGATSEVVNPSTGAVYATAPLSGEADIDRAMRRPPTRVRRHGATPRRASGRWR